jgi:hypothetical protein
MTTELDTSQPIPVIPIVLAAFFCIIGLVGLFDGLRPAAKRKTRVPSVMDTLVGRACISLWCLAFAAIGFGRAFRLPLVTSHENWFYAAGLGSLAFGLIYGYFARRMEQQRR